MTGVILMEDIKMSISDYYPEEKAVGPHKKFMMFFTDNLVPWVGGNVEFGVDFFGCLILCSTYKHMKRVLSGRPEVEEFRQKWNKEITPVELDAFINWVLRPDSEEGLSAYQNLFAAIVLALEPFYKTDEYAKLYIDNSAKTGGIVGFLAREIQERNLA
jgi:hypothetical protein